MIHVTLPTYQRLKLLKVAVDSIYSHIPADLLGHVVVTTNERPLPIVPRATVRAVSWRKGQGVGPSRHAAAVYLQDKVSMDDVFFFIDDDVELNDTLKPVLPDLLKLLADRHTGCVQLAANKPAKDPWQKLKLGFTGGGIFVRVGTYFDFGGFGQDDDIELFLRAYIAGLTNYKCGLAWSYHTAGLTGGLRAIRGKRGIEDGRSSLRDLAKVYPDFIETTDKWPGYRLKKSV